MSRSAVQVPDDIKQRMEEFKEKLYAKSLHELIEKLMNAYEKNQQKRLEESEKNNLEKYRQLNEVIELGEDYKKKCNELKKDLRFKHDSSVFMFLHEHYKNSPDLNKDTFHFYKDLIESRG